MGGRARELWCGFWVLCGIFIEGRSNLEGMCTRKKLSFVGLLLVLC